MWSIFVNVVLFYFTLSGAEEALPWWRTAVFYQVLPISFKDSDGDGFGDLKGISEKASYFKEIGVDAIWLSPIFDSPMRDLGYDIANYKTIHPIYGNIHDFEEMMAAYKALDIKVCLDLVPNHSSDQHEWFQMSINTSHPLHEYYKDFYAWQPPKGWTSDNQPVPPNNWLSEFGGSAWEWSDDRRMFYYHDFTKQQPELNYRCPAVVSNMTDALNYWLDKGVDGFRVDAAKYMFENESLPDESVIPGKAPGNYWNMIHNYTTDQPETFALFLNWTDMVIQRNLRDGKQRAFFHEVYDPLKAAVHYYGTGNRSLQMPFNFGFVDGCNYTLRPKDFKEKIDSWMMAMPNNSVPNWVFANHDNPRPTTLYGPEMTDAITILSGVLPGVKCVYFGEEIGMQDTLVLFNESKFDFKAKSMGPEEFLKRTRDPERTPMQWDSSISAGFSTNRTTWLPVNPNYWWLNVEAQRAAPVSHLKVFQAVSRARKDPVLQRGDLNVFVPDDDTLLVVRHYNDTYFVLVINMGSYVLTYTSQSLFSRFALDKDMTVVVASVNSDYNPGLKMRQGSVQLSLKPKAAVLLRTGNFSTSSSVNTIIIASPLAQIILLICLLLYTVNQ